MTNAGQPRWSRRTDTPWIQLPASGAGSRATQARAGLPTTGGLDGLARALKNWQDTKQGRRAGPRMGFPKRKRKGRGTESCRFTTGAIRVEADRHHVTLPRIGRIRTHESTRKLARRLGQGTARIMTATATRRGDRWFVSFTCGVNRAISQPRRSQATVGVEVGIRHLAVLSDGRLVPNPAPLRQAQRRLRRLHRQLARRRGPKAADGSWRTHQRAGSRPDVNSAGSMPESPTCGTTACTS